MPHEFTPTRLGTLCVGSVRIWFDVDVQSAAAGYPNSGYEAVGTPIPHPGWTDLSVLPKSSNTYDMGIVVLDGALDPALTAGRYGQVANVGFLNGLIRHAVRRTRTSRPLATASTSGSRSSSICGSGCTRSATWSTCGTRSSTTAV